MDTFPVGALDSKCDIKLNLDKFCLPSCYSSYVNVLHWTYFSVILFLIWLKYFFLRLKKRQFVYEGRFDSKNIIKFAFVVWILLCVAWEYHLLHFIHFHCHPYSVFACVCVLFFSFSHFISFPFLIFIQQKWGRNFFCSLKNFVLFCRCFKLKNKYGSYWNMILSRYQDLFVSP